MEEKMIDVNQEWFDVYQALSAPFPKEHVHWRVGQVTKDKKKGFALAYLNARDVMARLDQIVGPHNWQDDYAETPSGRVLCKLTIMVAGRAVQKVDGAGDTSYEGEKGAISDAFKRAAVKFGIGRYLYYFPTQWVELDSRGNFINPPKFPEWADPAAMQRQEAPKQEQPEEEGPSNVVDFPQDRDLDRQLIEKELARMKATCADDAEYREIVGRILRYSGGEAESPYEVSNEHVEEFLKDLHDTAVTREENANA